MNKKIQPFNRVPLKEFDAFVRLAVSLGIPENGAFLEACRKSRFRANKSFALRPGFYGKQND